MTANLRRPVRGLTHYITCVDGNSGQAHEHSPNFVSMTSNKKLSNPASTGGLGGVFEGHVQASYVALMLTEGHAPGLPFWPIVEVKLQGKKAGFDTDDLIVTVENRVSKERRKLLAQIKHSISISEKSTMLGEVMQAAWSDFTNPARFEKGKDSIALITGAISKTDTEVTWLLNHARVHDATTFFSDVSTANFVSGTKREKLAVLRHHIKVANGGIDVTEIEFHQFLKHFYLLGYDLGEEEGVVLSLINSHISQFERTSPRNIWARIVTYTNIRNHHAGIITRENVPDDLKEIFIREVVQEIPEALGKIHSIGTEWRTDPDAPNLALAALLGSWQDSSPHDIRVVEDLLGIPYPSWLQKAREILHRSNSPLTLKDGVWTVVDRGGLWNTVASHVLDHNLEAFRSLAVTILKEPDPAFELPVEQRYAANVYGKVHKFSQALRRGVAEGLALLGSNPRACSNCTYGRVETVTGLAISEIFADADSIRWGSLNGLLPPLAEAAPDQFLDAVENALVSHPCPFDDLFAQEGDGVFGGNYMTGLLWALEGLAWEEEYFVRACNVLGDLGAHDPGGRWVNRPSNSLVSIVLPWLPQTLASPEKRKVAVETLLKDTPDVAWQLLLNLLPGQHQTSSGTHKPQWRRTIAEKAAEVTQREYFEQVVTYAGLAIDAAGSNIARLAQLIDRFDELPRPCFDRLVDVLSSEPVAGAPEADRLLLWEHLSRFTTKHRRFADAAWALPSELVSRVEQVALTLAPADPFHRYRPLFNNRDFDLFEENGNWEGQRRALDKRREHAIVEIYQLGGLEGVVGFAERVVSPRQVGISLAARPESDIDYALLPSFLNSDDRRRRHFAEGYVWARQERCGWAWSDSLDKSRWTEEQVGKFLVCLPFESATWQRVSYWLRSAEARYWSRVTSNFVQAGDDLQTAVEKFLHYGRPGAAIDCLDKMRFLKQSVDVEQCVRALLAAATTKDAISPVDQYELTELIKFLQLQPTVNPDDLANIEWMYLPLLNRHEGASPKLLEYRLSTDPQFFVEVLQLVYRSTNDEEPSKKSGAEVSQAIASNAWQLLRQWQVPPGSKQDGTFDGSDFTAWLETAQALTAKSGHLRVALVTIGQVLIHVPADPGGLWMNRVVAEALNGRDAADMRDGYRTGVVNARGPHWVDPTGAPERELAEQFRVKAEAMENVRFQRFATVLKQLAKSYDRDAERILDEFKDRKS